jgi:fructose-1,6-bisphosphatase/sedoheptulose 1,7-bisphosphatase-like protein
MVWGERVIFVLSGVTDGLLVRGIEDTPEGLEIQSFLLDSELDEGHILDVRVEREN